MNITDLYANLKDNPKVGLENIFKSTDDIMTHFDDLQETMQDLIVAECDNPNAHAQELRDLANEVAKKFNVKPNLSNFSSKEKAERKKLHDLAKNAIAVGMTRTLTQKTIFTGTCVVKDSGNTRTFSSIMSGLFRSARDEKDVIEAINFINDKNNKQEDIAQKQDFLNTWFNGRIKDITKKLNNLCYEQSDLDLINFAKNDFPLIVGATEFQGDAIKQVAKTLNIKLDDNIYKEFSKVNGLMVEIGFNVADRVGNIANALYTEFSKNDIEKINALLEQQGGFSYQEDFDLKETIYTETTKNGFANQYKQYTKNTGRFVDSMKFVAELTEKAERMYALNDDKMSDEEKAEEILKNEEYKQESLSRNYRGYGKQLKTYLQILQRDKTNGEELLYSLNGKVVDENVALTEAVKGSRIQVCENKLDEKGKPNGKYLFTLQVSQKGTFMPVNTGKPLEWNYVEAKEAANHTNTTPAEKKQIYIDNTDGKLKENLDLLYNNLKAGSRFWISSKGEYGQLMNQIDECRKGDFSNREQLHNRIANIKKTASDYFMKRLGKTDRSALAIQREEAVEKVLNTFGNEYEKQKEIEASFDELVNTNVKPLKSKEITNQKELVESLERDVKSSELEVDVDENGLINIKGNEKEIDDFDEEKEKEEIIQMINND